MNTFQYCPNCGQKTIRWDNRKWSCNCGLTLYHNVAGAVAVMIRHKNEILFTKRNNDPHKDKLDLAGGFVDPEESAEETCKRELWEELKLKVDFASLRYISSLPNIYHYKGIDYHTLDLFFEYGIPEKPEIIPELSEISETRWIPIHELRLEDLAFDSQKKFLQDYLKI